MGHPEFVKQLQVELFCSAEPVRIIRKPCRVPWWQRECPKQRQTGPSSSVHQEAYCGERLLLSLRGREGPSCARQCCTILCSAVLCSAVPYCAVPGWIARYESVMAKSRHRYGSVGHPEFVKHLQVELFCSAEPVCIIRKPCQVPWWQREDPKQRQTGPSRAQYIRKHVVENGCYSIYEAAKAHPVIGSAVPSCSVWCCALQCRTVLCPAGLLVMSPLWLNHGTVMALWAIRNS